jgi:hypothetical protein
MSVQAIRRLTKSEAHVQFRAQPDLAFNVNLSVIT